MKPLSIRDTILYLSMIKTDLDPNTTEKYLQKMETLDKMIDFAELLKQDIEMS